MTKTMRMYPVKYMTSEDKHLIEDCNRYASNPDEIKKTEQYMQAYKQFCNIIRNSAGIENVIGLGVRNDNKEVVVFVYDIMATEDNFFTQYRDENHQPYIEVEVE